MDVVAAYLSGRQQATPCGFPFYAFERPQLRLPPTSGRLSEKADGRLN